MDKIILYVLFLTSLGLTSGDVGKKFRHDGEDAIVGEFPYIAHLFDNFYDGNSWCSGVIIDKEWVIISSMCLTLGNNGLVFTAGQLNIAIDEGNEQASHVVAVIVHPDNDTPHFNGMALMKVSPPFKFNDFVQPARLATTVMEQNVSCTAAGWVVDYNEELNPILRKVDLERVPDELCEELQDYPEPYGVMCAAGRDGSDSGHCIGDFGGPLICHDAGQGDVLCGISYEGSDYTCTGPKPRLFTKIEPLVDWIHETIENYDGMDEISWTETTTCGGVLSSSGGRINYKVGENYDENERCVWTIVSTVGNNMISYGLQQDYGLADGDWVGYTSISDEMGELNFINILKPSVTKTSTELVSFIVFFTGEKNSTHPGQGFSFMYSMLQADVPPPVLNYHHEHHKNPQGFISYPPGDVEYKENELATWVLNPNSFNAQLTVSRFELDTHGEDYCLNDYFWLYALTLDGGKIKFVLMLCGTLSELRSAHTTTGVFIAVFKSDGQNQATGFDFFWETLPDGTIPTTTLKTTPKPTTSLSTNSTTVVTTDSTTPRTNSPTVFPSSSISTNPTLSTTVLTSTTTSNLETTTEGKNEAIRINRVQKLLVATAMFAIMFIF